MVFSRGSAVYSLFCMCFAGVEIMAPFVAPHLVYPTLTIDLIFCEPCASSVDFPENPWSCNCLHAEPSVSSSEITIMGRILYNFAECPVFRDPTILVCVMHRPLSEERTSLPHLTIYPSSSHIRSRINISRRTRFSFVTPPNCQKRDYICGKCYKQPQQDVTPATT